MSSRSSFALNLGLTPEQHFWEKYMADYDGSNEFAQRYKAFEKVGSLSFLTEFRVLEQ